MKSEGGSGREAPSYWMEADQDYGYKFGQGMTGKNGCGSAGGGWYGGYAVEVIDKNMYGGAGGSGYVSEDLLQDPVSLKSDNLGNGKVKIRYEGKQKVKITINFYNCAELNGESKVVMYYEQGDTVQLNINNKSGYNITGYNTKNGDSTLGTDGKLKVGLKTSCQIDAVYNADLILESTAFGGELNLKLVEDDEISKYYRLYESTDGTHWQFVKSDDDDYNSQSRSSTYSSPGTVYTYKSSVNAVYKIEMYGASGGNSVANGDLENTGGKGGYTYGEITLEDGDRLYVCIGGKGEDGHEGNTSGGYNGGGSGTWDGQDDQWDDGDGEGSGGGGGCTSITTVNRGQLRKFNSHRNEVIAVAGGGGGGSYHYQAGNGGGTSGHSNSTGLIATQTSGYAFGYGQNGWGVADSDGVGGGGGGWYGGYTSDTSCASAGGGGSGYIGGLDNGVTRTSTHTGNGWARISYEDYMLFGSELTKITIKDKAAPNTPTDGDVIADTNGGAVIYWKNNGDNGTTYYHKASSFYTSNGNKIHDSNITEDYIESGVVGYLYYIDSNPTGIAKKTNSEFIEQSFVQIESPNGIAYIHVAAIDRAGNISETLNIAISKQVIYAIDDDHSITKNNNGDNYTTWPSGSILPQTVYVGYSVNIKDNNNTNSEGFTRVGYHQVKSDYSGIEQYEWNTREDGGGRTYHTTEEISYNDIVGESVILYPVWEANTYTVTLHGNGNWNNKNSWDDNTAYAGAYVQEMKYDHTYNLLPNEFTREDNSSGTWCKYQLEGGYSFIGWDPNKNRSDGDTKFKDKQSVKNLTAENNGNLDYYAIWKKVVTLEMNYNGGMNKGIKGGKTLTPIIIYNSIYECTFDISQFYGTSWDSDGINDQFTKVDESTGQQYRFIGWNTDATASEPLEELCVYNTNRKTTYTVHDNEVLYAVYEPVMGAAFELKRSLGDLQYDDNTNPRSKAQNITASVPSQQVDAIIRPGEQGEYTITAQGKDIDISVIFDTRITDIYNNQGTWTDSLNPSGHGEELVSDQKHGLDRTFSIENTGESKTRKFYMPQYIGTSQSYYTSNPSDSGRIEPINKYLMIIQLEQDSYYYKYVYNTKETIQVTGLITINRSKGSTDTGITTVLDELRTRLRTRIVN